MIILRLILISIISSTLGLLPFLLSIILSNYFSGIEFNFTGLIKVLGFYAVVVFNASILVSVMGSVIYLLLFKFNLANYVTSFFAGSLSLLLNQWDGVWVFFTISGFIIAPLYHFYFNKYKVLCK
jgi:hypothetical protein